MGVEAIREKVGIGHAFQARKKIWKVISEEFSLSKNSNLQHNHRSIDKNLQVGLCTNISGWFLTDFYLPEASLRVVFGIFLELGGKLFARKNMSHPGTQDSARAPSRQNQFPATGDSA